MKKIFFILLTLITLTTFAQQQKIGPEFGNVVIRGGLVINNVPPGSTIDSILTRDSTGLVRLITAGSIITPTPNIEQVLNAGSTFATSHTIDANDFNFAINDVNVFEVKSGDDTYVGAIAAWAVDVSGSAQYSQSAAGIGTRIIASPTKSFLESFNAGDTSYVRVNTDGSIRLYDADGIFFESMLNTDATKFLTLNASGQLVLVTPGAGTSGTVTSVGLAAPAIFSVTGSPVTTAGTLNLALVTQTAAKVFASPTASTGVPTFRLLAATDIPSLTASKISNFVATVRTSISLTTTGTSGAATYNNSTGVLNIPNYATGGGGTVTNFSAGDLSPLFTTTEATTTTTPALSFTLSNAAANTYFGNNTGGSAAPAFHNFPSIPAQFNPIAGTNITLSGTYPNITFNSSGGGGGSVTSVALTVPSAFNVSGSPVTTSGTLAITGAGTSAQYVNGAGGLTTFPSIPAQFNLIAGTNITTNGTYPNITVNSTAGGSGLTSVGISGANGIGVTNSPLTANGTIALSLGAITPTSVAASGTMSGSNLSGTNTGDQTVPAQFNPIAGTNVTLSGTYPNITFNASGGGSIPNLDQVAAVGGFTNRNIRVGEFTSRDVNLNTIFSTQTEVGGGTIIQMGDIIEAGNGTTFILHDEDARYYFSKRGFDFGGVVWAFPAVQGAANTFLKNDGSGNLTWATTSGGSGTVTSVGLTSSDITVGGTSPITTSGTYTLTLPTVNSNVGTFTHATLTVNAKGQVTAASSGSVPAQFNPIAGLGMTLSGSYPNITFNSTATLDDILNNGNQSFGNSALTQGFINTGFQQQHTTTNSTGVAYTVGTNDYHVYADANVTLPTPTTGTGSSTRVLIIQNSKTSGSINVIPPAGEEIHDKGGVTYTNGSPLVLATEDESVTLKSANGLYWVVIARN